MTVDGKTDTVHRNGTIISSVEDLERVDRLRAEVDTILVGGHTLLENDLRLIVKNEHLRQEHLHFGLCGVKSAHEAFILTISEKLEYTG